MGIDTPAHWAANPMSVTTLGWDDYRALGIESHLFVILAISGITIGVVLASLVVSAVTLIKQRKPLNRAFIITFLAIINLLLLLAFCVIQILLVGDRITSAGYQTFGSSVFFESTSTSGLRRARILLELIMMSIGDYVVLGRAKAVYAQQKWVGRILLGLWVICIGWGIAFYAILMIDIDHPETYYDLNKYAIVFSSFSNIVNCLATGLIGYKLWSYRNYLKEIGFRRPRYSLPQRALLVMTESGYIFVLSQITFFAFSVTVSYNNKVNNNMNVVMALPIVQQLFYVICGLYPVSVYFLLAYQSQRDDHYGIMDMDSSQCCSKIPR